jgi:group I intron endonuclease
MINKGIYKIINILNQKYYVGSSINLEERKQKHFRTLRRNKHVNDYLQNAWNKYGEENFKWEIVEILNDLDLAEIRKVEQKYIDADFDNQYNIAKDTMTPGIYSEEVKQKQINACRDTIRPNNKTGHTGIYYSEKEKDYRPSIQVWGIRVFLGSYKTLQEAINKRKEAEEYFWQPCIDQLPKHLKQEIVKQYKEACKPIRSKTNIEGVTYALGKGHSVFITTKDNIAINLSNYLSFEDAVKLRKNAEQYFYSDDFINLSIEQKEEAIKHYKDKLKTSKIKSGHQFIIWDGNSGKWIVKPKIDNVLLNLGSFKDLNKAVICKEKAFLYFNSQEFLSNNLEDRLKLAQKYKKQSHSLNNLDRSTGVTFHKATQSWRAYIMVNKKNISLGQYLTKEMALQARKEGELKYRNNT